MSESNPDENPTWAGVAQEAVRSFTKRPRTALGFFSVLAVAALFATVSLVSVVGQTSPLLPYILGGGFVIVVGCAAYVAALMWFRPSHAQLEEVRGDAYLRHQIQTLLLGDSRGGAEYRVATSTSVQVPLTRKQIEAVRSDLLRGIGGPTTSGPSQIAVTGGDESGGAE